MRSFHTNFPHFAACPSLPANIFPYVRIPTFVDSKFSCVPSLAMRRPHSDGTWHLLGHVYLLHITRAPFAHIRMGACGLARECCPCFNGTPLVVLI
jgi:hypothetical protein